MSAEQPDRRGPPWTGNGARVPGAIARPWALPVLVTIVGAIALAASDRPLGETAPWIDLAYGRWIFEHGRVPRAEPLQGLAEGMALIDAHWLGQVAGYSLLLAGGPSGLRTLHAALVAACASAVAWSGGRPATRLGRAAAGVGLFAGVAWRALATPGPGLAGLACFAALFAILKARRPGKAHWVLVPSVFALWANLHPSFPAGLAVLGLLGLGRAIEVGRRAGGFRAIVLDGEARRLILWAQLGLAATLLNPYGLALYAGIALGSGDAGDAAPLTLRSPLGQAACIAALLLAVARRRSSAPRRLREDLVLTALGVATWWSSTWLPFWAVAAANDLMRHLPAERASSPRWRVGLGNRFRRRSPRATAAAAGIAWAFLIASPGVRPLLPGGKTDSTRDLSPDLPTLAVDYLRERGATAAGLVSVGPQWTDYLIWAGPPGLQVFGLSRTLPLPSRVRDDAARVQQAGEDWERILRRYGVAVVILDRRAEGPLAGPLRGSAGWKADREDRTCAIYVRREPLH